MNMNGTILVTGGAGYIGNSVVSELINTSSVKKIVIFDNFSKARAEAISKILRNEKIILIPGEKADIRDAKNVEEAIKQHAPETIIHLAAKLENFTKDREGKDIETEQINHIATTQMAEIAKRSGVKNFIFQSTASIYKAGPGIKEDDEKQPQYAYAKSKLSAEEDLLKLADDSFRVAILRPASVAGYNSSFRYETMLNIMCLRAVYKIPINIFKSAMEVKKSTLSVNDDARAIVFALNNIEQISKIPLNVSSFDCTLKEVLDLLIESEGNSFPYIIVEEETAKDRVYTLNTEKIKGFGFEPKDTLRETILKTVKMLKKRKALEETQL
jgi:nucleoside-diphosphate-sugar epimerase